MRQSIEVEHILEEASEMARAGGHSITTGHILLGMLTSPNRAAQLLGDLRIDAERVLEGLKYVKRETGRLEDAQDLLELMVERMFDAARRTDAALVSSLHLLLALTRDTQSVAYRIFVYLGTQPREVRTMVLSRIHGPVPRELTRRPPPTRPFRGEPERPVGVLEPEREPARPARPQAAVARQQPTWDEGETDEPIVLPPVGTAVRPLPVPAVEEAEPWMLDAEQFPLLTSLGRNLTAEAAAGRIDPVIGRHALIEAMIDILNKRRSNNPCLVGEPGVGKTAVVEGLARALLEHGERIPALRDRVIISLDVGSLVAGTELRGAFSRRMAQLKEEVRQSAGRVIVFIDEIHTLVGAGAGDGAMDAANDLKAALARGEFPCIGATTTREYHRHIERDPALERRFQPLEVEEPNEADALHILRGIVPQYETHHGVVYLPESLEAAVRMSRRYIVDRRLPDKAINLIDTAAARAVRQGKESVEPADIAEVVSEVARIPVERLLMSDSERILGIRDFLGERIVGHPDVLDVVSQVIQRNSAGFASQRPIGSFLFLGPTGVGKTETAKVLADFLFCSKDALTRFDMSEYMERHTVSRLLGAAPGYVGHEEAGALTASLSRRPYQIMLFDEIEKAHADVLNILLQILDEGRVTDAKGRVLNLSSTVIIMTSNLGADALDGYRKRRIGFGEGDDMARPGPEDMERVRAAARKALPPELWGRIEEHCVFGPLARADVAAITAILVGESSDRLQAERGIRYEASPEVVAWLIDHGGWEPALGARPMRGAVQRQCETAVARAILGGRARSGDRLRLVLREDGLEVEVLPAEPEDALD
ncbi:MAG: ATP-dependent Clp protease ATP-binding subunit [Deltaproteobacteria bacterium]|nr:ATP-dependent Clp protease ATP-binding subunit [Deltaproteobacteria bacterium]MCB9786478.1 ATP-dependent Clp protease ATP-binding subunit [Deltaproteobacteria bacterium]